MSGLRKARIIEIGLNSGSICATSKPVSSKEGTLRHPLFVGLVVSLFTFVLGGASAWLAKPEPSVQIEDNGATVTVDCGEASSMLDSCWRERAKLSDENSGHLETIKRMAKELAELKNEGSSTPPPRPVTPEPTMRQEGPVSVTGVKLRRKKNSQHVGLQFTLRNDERSPVWLKIPYRANRFCSAYGIDAEGARYVGGNSVCGGIKTSAYHWESFDEKGKFKDAKSDGLQIRAGQKRVISYDLLYEQGSGDVSGRMHTLHMEFLIAHTNEKGQPAVFLWDYPIENLPIE